MKDKDDIMKITQTIIDFIDEHILVCNLEGQIIFANNPMKSYLGYTDSELKKKNLLDIFADIHIDKAKAFIDSVSEEPSKIEHFLFKGKKDTIKLHIKILCKDNLIYLYGSEKQINYERIKRKLDNEIANAIKIHKRSFPETLPETEDISFASLYIPAEKLGGDLFDVFKVDNGLLNDYFEQYVCFISDVSGHGLDSAMLSIFVKDIIRSFFRLKHIPGQLLSPKEIMDFFVEQYLKEGYPEEYLVCIFLAVFDIKTKELTYCNAGIHKFPLLLRDGDNIFELDNVGLPISTAIDADMLKYEDFSVKLSPGMTLFIMSDGLPEQRCNNIYYEERLRELIKTVGNLEPVHIVERIHEDFMNFLRKDKNSDDVTLVVVNYQGYRGK